MCLFQGPGQTNLYNKRACPQTMFKILCLRRQHCQIKRITGLPKTWEQERERETRPAWAGFKTAEEGRAKYM